jgi:hemoglobin
VHLHRAQHDGDASRHGGDERRVEAFVEDVVATLNDFKVGKAEQDELLNILAPLRGEIVEVDSDQTGTPLPSAFTPAPPL